MIRVITILIAIFQFSNAYDTSSYYSSSRSKNEEKNVVEDADKIVDELWYAFNEGRRVRRLRSRVSHISWTNFNIHNDIYLYMNCPPLSI